MDIIDNSIAKNALVRILNYSDQYKTLENKSLVIFLDSKWGTGKTTFLKEFQRAHTSFKYIYYDAWKYDDWSEPMSPIIHCLKAAKEIDDKVDDYVEAIINLGFKKSVNLLTSLIFDVIQNKLGISESTIAQIIDLPKEIKDEVDEKDLLKYSEGFEAFTKTKAALSKYLSENLNDDKIVFIIDELDRCKPLFAIETLEFIKHFFNECNMTFIVSSDISQLGESIKAVYGNIDYNIYLSKFYDYKFDLPFINIKTFIAGFFAHTDALDDIPNTRKYLYEFAEELNISLRELQKIIKYTMLNADAVNESSNLQSFIFMLVLKQIDIISYSRIINNQYSNERQRGLPQFLYEKYHYISFLNTNANDFNAFLREENNKNIKILRRLEVY